MVDSKKIEEEIPIELLQKGIIIKEDEAKEHETLTLTEIEGSLLNGNQYTIDARGVHSTARKVEDGISLFGIPKTESSFIPDVALNLSSDLLSKVKNLNIFKIYYRRDFQKFYLEAIQENKETFFIFVLLDQPHLLTPETIVVSVQNFNFKIRTSNDNKEVIVEYGQSDNLDKSVLNFEKKKIFYIGRKDDNDIVLNQNCVSREQMMIFFDKGNWYIKDGGKENPSRNGTWLFVERNYQIKNTFTFKIGPSTMKVEVTKPINQN